MEGLALLKQVTRADWLRQPEQDMRPFEAHHCKDAWLSPRGQIQRKGWWYYDKHAAFLAAASSVKLGVGRYEHITDQAAVLQATLPTGVYLVGIHDTVLAAQALHFPTAESWQYAPVLRYWATAGVVFSIREAYYYPEQHYCFRAFYEALKTRRDQGEDVKPLYTHTFGMLAHKPTTLWRGCLYRPDWYHSLKAELKARMWHHAQTVYDAEGVWPIAMNVDALYYTQQVHSLRLGDGIGAFEEKQL